MHLLLRKSQRDDGWFSSSMTFILDIRLDLTQEELHLLQKYALADVVVYDSNARVQYAADATEHFEAASIPATTSWNPSAAELASAFAQLSSQVWNLAAGAAHELMSAVALQITLGSMVDGQQVESQDLHEIITVADNVYQAAQYLADAIKASLSFDGRESLDEF